MPVFLAIFWRTALYTEFMEVWRLHRPELLGRRTPRIGVLRLLLFRSYIKKSRAGTQKQTNAHFSYTRAFASHSYIVTLEAPATTPLTVTLTSSQRAATLQTSVIISVGQTTGNFVINSGAVSSLVTAVITARANGTAKSQGLSLYPVGTKLAIATITGSVTLEGCVAPAQQITFVLRPTDGTAEQTKTLPLGNDGSFTLAGVLTQNYTLWIKGAKWLAKAIPADASRGGASGLAVTLPAGDANDDNSVDTTDFGILVGAYNGDASVPGSGYDAAADFNCDGVVDTTDFGLLVGNYNAVGDN